MAIRLVFSLLSFKNKPRWKKIVDQIEFLPFSEALSRPFFTARKSGRRGLLLIL